MTVNGIIAEYNPFHKGHLYHLKSSEEKTDADYTIVVMSGSFTQRGEPAIIDKYTRTRMALASGASLVLELPVPYATASAEYFAQGAVTLLHQLGVVTHLCFGAESDDLSALWELAQLLLESPSSLSRKIKELSNSGLPYPAIRQQAVKELYGDRYGDDLLSSPNNILAIEYLKALGCLNSPILPCLIPRHQTGYHDLEARNGFASASGIRDMLYNTGDRNQIKPYLPEPAIPVLEDYFNGYQPVYPNDFSEILYYKLLMQSESGYDNCMDVHRDLSNRIASGLYSFKSFDQFVDLIDTRNITRTRCSRCLLHILLDIHELPPISYARILGFRSDAAPLLSALKKASTLPLISKLANAQDLLPADSLCAFKKELLQNRIYEGILAHKSNRTPRNELQIPIIIV